MQIRKPLLAFRTLIKYLKVFKEEVIPTAEQLETMDYRDEMKTLLTRYLILTQDSDFQTKIRELYYLETAIIQIRCINDITPQFFVSKPQNDDYIYVRGSFLDKTPVYQLARSIGKKSQYSMSVRAMSTNPDMLQKAQETLRLEMENRMIYEEYKLKFDGEPTTTA